MGVERVTMHPGAYTLVLREKNSIKTEDRKKQIVTEAGRIYFLI